MEVKELTGDCMCPMCIARRLARHCITALEMPDEEVIKMMVFALNEELRGTYIRDVPSDSSNETVH